MAINKVVYGNETLLDLTNDTVSSEALVEGATAHGKDGEVVVGTNPYKKAETDATVDAQAGLIAQIKSALNGKAAGNGSGGIALPQLTTPATASDILLGKEAINGSGTKITGTIQSKSDNDLSVSGAAVTVPSGYYPIQVTKSVATVTQATPSVTVDANGLITTAMRDLP